MDVSCTCGVWPIYRALHCTGRQPHPAPVVERARLELVPPCLQHEETQAVGVERPGRRTTYAREANSPPTTRSDRDAAFHGIRQDGRGRGHAPAVALRRDGHLHRRTRSHGCVPGRRRPVRHRGRRELRGPAGRCRPGSTDPTPRPRRSSGAGPSCSTTASRRRWPTSEQFAQLHAKHWPEVTVISTLRQISTGPEAPGD